MKGLQVTNAFDPDTFDPSARGSYNNADGAAGTKQVSAKPGQKMQVNLAMNNAAAVALTFELFNWMNSFSKILNPAYATGNYRYIPLLTYEGIAANTTGGGGGTVGFTAAGNLVIRGNLTTPDPIGTIACSTNPYSAFFEASAIIPFQVAYIRQTSLTDAQIDNEITWFQRTFAGSKTQNNISPRSFFKPNQFQPLTVDVTIGFPVGIDAGLQVLVNAGENLRYALFINYWTRQVI